MARKQEIFPKKTAEEIKQGKRIVDYARLGDVIDKLMNRFNPEEECLRIYNAKRQTTVNLLPAGWDVRKFKAKGPRVVIMLEYNLFCTEDGLEKIARQGLTPVKLREGAFSRVEKSQTLSGYVIIPPSGDDKRARVFSLVDCCKGAKLYSYIVNNLMPKDLSSEDYVKELKKFIKVYDERDSPREVERMGAFAIVRVPSTTPKERSHLIRLDGIPVVDTKHKYSIAYSLVSDHSCLDKKFRFAFPSNFQKNKFMCFHDMAAYLLVIDYCWHRDKNAIPLEQSLFALPTQTTIDLFNLMENNVVIRYRTQSGRLRDRPLNEGEQEILLWRLVGMEGHDETFFARQKIRDYKW